jgi:hypothetical protein
MLALKEVFSGEDDPTRQRRAQLTAQFNVVLRSGCVPPEWALAVISPVFKGGSAAPSDALAYRSIAVQSATSKLFFLVLLRRLTAHLERHGGLHPMQSGFRAGRGCDDNLLLLHLLTEHHRLKGTGLGVLFVDQRRAYASVNHTALLSKLWAKGVRGRVWSVISDWLRQQTVAVRVGGQLSKQFKVNKGTPEGAVLSPILFVVHFDEVLWDLDAARAQQGTAGG